MRSRINSTGRQKIDSHMAAFAVAAKENSPAEFTAEIDLTALQLPPDGEVVVEAYRQSLHERFSFGRVSAIFPQQSTVLRELEAEGINFRIKVIEPATGRLLARGDRFSTMEMDESGRHELLKVVEKDLGQELWRTEIFDEDRKPVLVLNNHVPDAANRLKSDPILQAYILPAALRQVLMMLWIERAEEEADDEQHWTTQWIRFAQNLTDREKPDWKDREEVFLWIDEVCRRFSAEFHFADRLSLQEERA